VAEKKNYPFELVAKAAELFGWPKASMQEQALKRELRQAVLAINNHIYRVFPELDRQGVELKTAHTVLAAEDLLLILKDIHDNPANNWWADKFTNISMLDKFIVQKEREGHFRVIKNSKAVQDALKRF
jgi:hypothetical protein